MIQFWCWECMVHPVSAPFNRCPACQKAQTMRFRRWNEGRKTTTSESTHRQHRAKIEDADRIDTGKKPEYRADQEV